MSDLPTGPIPVVRAGRHRQRHRVRSTLIVLVSLAIVAGAAFAGVRLLSTAGGGGGGDTSPTLPPDNGLMPGAPIVVVPARAPAARISGVGFDISYPQCRSTWPSGAAFGIVGLNGGAPLLSNRCFADQLAWARRTRAYAVYVNTAYTGVGDPVAYGRRLAEDAIRRERAAGVSGIGMWWLDVELANPWKGTPRENATVLDSMAARLQQAGVRVGIYSSPDMWFEIAGIWEPRLPVWNAIGTGTQAQAAATCEESFAGSASAIVQWVAKRDGVDVDHNLVCPAFRTRAGDILAVTR